MRRRDTWRGRGLTARAMLLLLAARLTVAILPFSFWRGWLGRADPPFTPAQIGAARRLAAQVERGALRLPITTTCLHRALALGWLLGRSGIGHTVVFAVRPPGQRAGEDALHAWVEAGGTRILGDLPGEWIETARLDG